MKPKFSPIALVFAAFPVVFVSCRAVVPSLRAMERPAAEAIETVVPSPPVPWPTPAPPDFGRRHLYVTTRPEGAQVFLDGRFFGLTPLLLPDFSVGHYYLELDKDGWERHAEWIDYNDDRWAFFYPLVRETGVLDLRVSPPGAAVRTAARALRAGENRLPAGSYTLTVTAFGYAPRTADASVRAGETTILSFDLQKAAFAFSDLALSRRTINPLSSGPASSTALHFSVSGPGSGSLEAVGADGRAAARLESLAFASAGQTVTWNGRTDSGEPAPDGTYTLVLRGKGEGAAVEARVDVAVDSSFAIEHGALWSGSAGLWYVPSPLTLPASGFELNAAALASFADAPGFSVPAALGARLGLGEGHEVAAVCAAVFGEEGALAPGLSWKFRLLSTPGTVSLSAALQAKAAYAFNYHADLFTDPPGVSAGVPVRLALGPFALYLEPEFVLAFSKLSADPAFTPVPGAYAWLYGRAGLGFSAGPLSAGVSACVRTAPLDEGFSLAFPVQTAAEITVVFPDSPLSLSAAAVASWSPDGVAVWGGFGFGLLW